MPAASCDAAAAPQKKVSLLPPKAVIKCSSGKVVALRMRRRSASGDADRHARIDSAGKDAGGTDVTQEQRITWKPSIETLRQDDVRCGLSETDASVVDDLLPFTAESLWKGLLSRNLLSGKVATKRASDMKHDVGEVPDTAVDATSSARECEASQDDGCTDIPRVETAPTVTSPQPKSPAVTTSHAQSDVPATSQTSRKAETSKTANCSEPKKNNAKPNSQPGRVPKQRARQKKQATGKNTWNGSNTWKQWEERQERQRQQAFVWQYFQQMQHHHWQIHAQQQWQQQQAAAVQAEAQRRKELDYHLECLNQEAKRAHSTTPAVQAEQPPKLPPSIDATPLASVAPQGTGQAQANKDKRRPLPKPKARSVTTGAKTTPRDAEPKESNGESGSLTAAVSKAPEPTEHNQATNAAPLEADVKMVCSVAAAPAAANPQTEDEDDEEEDLRQVVEQRKRELMAKLSTGRESQSHSEGKIQSARSRSRSPRLGAHAARGHGGA